MDNTIHINVEIVHLETRGVGPSGIEGHTDGALVVNERDAFLEDILDDFGILLREPAVEGGNTHVASDE